MFTKKTIKDIDLQDKRVLLRADYNVPLNTDGSIADDYRIKQSVETIKALLDKNVRLVICSHLGRPEGKPDDTFSLRPVAVRLAELLGQDVQFAQDCIGDATQKQVDALQQRQILLLENVRFHPEEEKPTYGQTKNIDSYNPVILAFRTWSELFQAAIHSGSFKNGIQYFIRPPGWTHNGLSQTSGDRRKRAANNELNKVSEQNFSA